MTGSWLGELSDEDGSGGSAWRGAERLAFVLHDMFAVPFAEIAPVVDRSPAAARQLASRARRRVQGVDTSAATDRGRQRGIVAAFLAASRNGQFDALLAVLDPDVVLRADNVTVQMAAAASVLDASAVAETFSGRERAAQPVFVGGAAGAMGAVDGQPRVVFEFTITNGKIVNIDI